jgi:hypothetical protein
MTGKQRPRVKALPLAGFAAGAAPLPVLADKATRGLVPRPWRLVDVMDDGRRLVISLDNPRPPLGVQVTETAAEVSVTVFQAPPSGRASVLSQITGFAAVMLSAPIGNRRLTGGDKRT